MRLLNDFEEEAPPYDQIQFFGCPIRCGTNSVGDVASSFPFLPHDLGIEKEFELRVNYLASIFVDNCLLGSASENPSALKVLVLPEFYFRNHLGAYKREECPDVMAMLVSKIQNILTEKQGNPSFHNWVLMCGGVNEYQNRAGTTPQVYNWAPIIKIDNEGRITHDRLLKSTTSRVDYGIAGPGNLHRIGSNILENPLPMEAHNLIPVSHSIFSEPPALSKTESNGEEWISSVTSIRGCDLHADICLDNLINTKQKKGSEPLINIVLSGNLPYLDGENVDIQYNVDSVRTEFDMFPPVCLRVRGSEGFSPLSSRVESCSLSKLNDKWLVIENSTYRSETIALKEHMGELYNPTEPNIHSMNTAEVIKAPIITMDTESSQNPEAETVHAVIAALREENFSAWQEQLNNLLQMPNGSDILRGICYNGDNLLNFLARHPKYGAEWISELLQTKYGFDVSTQSNNGQRSIFFIATFHNNPEAFEQTLRKKIHDQDIDVESLRQEINNELSKLQYIPSINLEPFEAIVFNLCSLPSISMR